MSDRAFTFAAIGEVQSCFKEKFGIPRQPGLVPSARARILIYPEFASDDAFAGLEECSHLWLQFVFHATDAVWRPKVRPPRLGGNKTLGVFATRSPNRPNPIGLSVVSYLGRYTSGEDLWIEIGGADLLEGTPILDIKPYVPYADSVGGAFNRIAPAAPALHSVTFSDEALEFCVAYDQCGVSDSSLEVLVREVLQQDPRPQYQQVNPKRVYGMHLLDMDVRWCCQEQADNLLNLHVLKIAPFEK
jgi:tRNA-Thr(GGU) m(6)t(6)A37 methyltransferase TsaA